MEKIDEEKNQKETKAKSKDWLERLKTESWEAELLVSAISIFGTFQLFKLISWATNIFINLLGPQQYYIAYFIVFFGLIAVSALVSMFVIHFILRAYWIGIVGLNSVFPDYSIKDSAYSEIYTKKILSILPKLTDSIHKVDQLCSVIFSVAFALLLNYGYIALLGSLYLLLFNSLSEYVSSYILLIPGGLFILVLVFQTIFTFVANLKKYKNNETIQIWYFKTVQLGSIMVLGPLYKNLLQIAMTFGSNFKKNKALTRLVIMFAIAGLFVSVFKMKDTNIPYLIKMSSGISKDPTETFASYYKTENIQNDFLLNPEITSDIISSKISKLFIPIFTHERKSFQKNCSLFKENSALSKQQNKRSIQESYLNCYQQYNQIFLNKKEVKVDFIKYLHPITGQFGIICYLNAANFKEGKNILEVKKINTLEKTESSWSIPFQYFSSN